MEAQEKVAVVDRLRPRIVTSIVAAHPSRVIVLEPPDRRARIAEAALKLVKVSVEYPTFFMGDLVAATGESAYLTARDLSYSVAPAIVQELVQRSVVLRAVETLGRPGTLATWLTKTLLTPLFDVALRLEAARVLAAPARPTVWLGIPPELPLDCARIMAPDIEVVAGHGRLSSGWIMLGRAVIGEIFRAARGRLEKPTVNEWRTEPSIMTVQEEDLIDDPSYRGHLHWLHAGAVTPRCRTVVMPRRGGLHRCTATSKTLADFRVTLLSDGDISRCLSRAAHPVQRQLSRHEWACLRGAFTASLLVYRFAAVRAWVLVRTARRISAVIEATGARAWVGCEAYFPHADAVHLVADAHSLRTCSFQYGSIRARSPQMVSTVDVAATLGTAYASLYEPVPFGPKEITPIGYPYCYASALVAGRAQALRSQLKATGAQFVICYFDESVQYTHWGLISTEHHLGELAALARAVLDDPTLAVLVKTKYTRNAPARLYADQPNIRAAAATGRLHALTAGQHRNAIFPVEAALAADICIGHAFGATAALESALASRRAVLVRRYGERTLIDHHLAQLDVVYPSVEAALEAIAAYRRGDRARQTLGDWTAALPQLDAYRDGDAPARLHALLERWAREGVSQSPATVGGVKRATA